MNVFSCEEITRSLLGQKEYLNQDLEQPIYYVYNPSIFLIKFVSA